MFVMAICGDNMKEEVYLQSDSRGDGSRLLLVQVEEMRCRRAGEWECRGT